MNTVYGLFGSKSCLEIKGHEISFKIFMFEHKEDLADGDVTKASYTSVMTILDSKTDENGMIWHAPSELGIFEVKNGEIQYKEGHLFDGPGIELGNDKEFESSPYEILPRFIAATVEAAKELEEFNIEYIDIADVEDPYGNMWNLRVKVEKGA